MACHHGRSHARAPAKFRFRRARRAGSGRRSCTRGSACPRAGGTVRRPRPGRAVTSAGQCRNASSTWTTMASTGSLPSIASRCSRSSSCTSVAEPLTRSVSSMPGMRNSSPTRGFCGCSAASRSACCRVDPESPPSYRPRPGRSPAGRPWARRRTDLRARRSHQHERRVFDERSTMHVQSRELPSHGTLARAADHLAQLRDSGQASPADGLCHRASVRPTS